jgi:hypothetical protein
MVQAFLAVSAALLLLVLLVPVVTVLDAADRSARGLTFAGPISGTDRRDGGELGASADLEVVVEHAALPLGFEFVPGASHERRSNSG